MKSENIALCFVFGAPVFMLAWLTTAIRLYREDRTMTTAAAAALYPAQHNYGNQHKDYAVYNPHNKPFDELPVIYGFNNGGSKDWLQAELMAEDGTYLGGHICSAEGHMPHDLGILEGSRPDRHETFRKHYPDGYRMDFVSYADASKHEGLKHAFELYAETVNSTKVEGNQ